jgi:hypothetical protein
MKGAQAVKSKYGMVMAALPMLGAIALATGVGCAKRSEPDKSEHSILSALGNAQRDSYSKTTWLGTIIAWFILLY